MFSNITKYQVHVEHSGRMAELANRAFDRALQCSGPTQLNYSRNILNDVHEYDFPIPRGKYNPIVPDAATIDQIVDQLLAAEKPVLLAGYGLSNPAEVQKLSALLDIPVATTYLHNDTFPSSDPRAVGSLGYMGSKAAMRCVQESDLVVAIGSRLNPFGTTPQYGMPYWDPSRPLIQIDQNVNALAVSCMPSLAVHGDAVATITAVNARLAERQADVAARSATPLPYAQYRDEWKAERDNVAPPTSEGRLPPKTVLHTLAKVMKTAGEAIVTTDIGHCCSQALAYLEFERPQSLFTAGTFGSCGTAIPLALGARFADADRPIFALVGDGAVNMQGINELLTAHRNKLGITILCFRNEVWGAELLNQLIWTDARAVGTEIDTPSIANIASAYMAHGERVEGSVEALQAALERSVERQKAGQTTLLEVMCTSEMGAPFRSDAMSCPTRHLPKYQHLTTTTADYSRQYVPKKN
jgi:sulfoacetaldehyde acetyltransferase